MAKHLTVKELAEQWRKSPEWITERARQGEIPGAWKLGRQWRFSADEIESYEQSQRVQNQSEYTKNQGERTQNIFALTPRSRKLQQNKKRS